jgi:hypothetical protein
MMIWEWVAHCQIVMGVDICLHGPYVMCCPALAPKCTGFAQNRHPGPHKYLQASQHSTSLHQTLCLTAQHWYECLQMRIPRACPTAAGLPHTPQLHSRFLQHSACPIAQHSTYLQQRCIGQRAVEASHGVSCRCRQVDDLLQGPTLWYWQVCGAVGAGTGRPVGKVQQVAVVPAGEREAAECVGTGVAIRGVQQEAGVEE